MFIGVVGGHCFYYLSRPINILGMLLLVLADALDSADGQLARLTGIHSKYGRIIDGLVGNVIFISIYIHLCLRYMAGGGTPWIFGLGVVAGISHSFQCAMADYYRNGYLYFVKGGRSGELDASISIRGQYELLSWRGHLFQKMLQRLYLNYTLQQEFLAQTFQRLRKLAAKVYGENLSLGFKASYRRLNLPMIKYYNILTINTRVIALFVFIYLRKPQLFFLFEILILNLILVYVLFRQEKISGDLIVAIESEQGK